MKINIGKNNLYLIGVYFVLAMIIRFAFADKIGIGSYWQPVIYASLLIFIILSHDTLLKAIGRVTGDVYSNELDIFSEVLELNKKIQNYIDADKVLRMVDVALRDQLNADEVIIFLNENIEVELISPLKVKSKSGSFNKLRLWSESSLEHWELPEEFVNEAIRTNQIYFKNNELLPENIELFERTGTDLAIPIVHNRQLLCLILLANIKHSKNFNSEHIKVLEYLASQLALILDRIRIYQQVMLQTAMDHAEKMQVMQSISSNIAHEMRTPLSGIRASISGVEEYLPELIKAYNHGRQTAPEKFPMIREEHINGLKSTPGRITLMIDQANTVIDMLLMNLRETSLDENQMNLCPAAECIEQAVERYPFKRGEREKVELDVTDNFQFLGIESMFVYVIFNLLKNALYSLGSAQKGKIYITLETGKILDPSTPEIRSNMIYFRDTGEGIGEEELGKIFDGFFTTKEGGTGAGLAYCKRTIENFHGKIECESVIGEYCEFKISLPPVNAFS